MVQLHAGTSRLKAVSEPLLLLLLLLLLAQAQALALASALTSALGLALVRALLLLPPRLAFCSLPQRVGLSLHSPLQDLR
jgi:hypothetical protein